MTSIGLRATASKGSDSYDMAKAYVNDDNLFQLYTLSDTKAKLSANVVPLIIDSVVMAFNPSKYGGTFNLTSMYTESLTNDGVWLSDLKTRDLVDMKTTTNYQFISQPSDALERFILLFKRPAPSGITEINYNLRLFYGNKKVHIKDLNESDLGSKITLLNVQGKQLYTSTVSNFPEMTIDLNNIMPGVYMVHLIGARTSIAKFVVY